MLEPRQFVAYFKSYFSHLKPKHKVKCPFHDDHHPSMDVDGPRGIFYCFACGAAGGIIDFEVRMNGGTREEAWKRICERLHLNGSVPKPKLSIYDYTDEQGKLLYQVLVDRGVTPKKISQRRPDGAGDWVWSLDGVPRVLYRLPEVLQAEEVWVPEGEQCVNALRDLGLTATTNSGGALKFRPEFAEYFRGKRVLILPDNDPIDPKRGFAIGHRHAEQVAGYVVGVAASVKLVYLPNLGESEDVFDWLARGGTKAELLKLAEASPQWKPPVLNAPSVEVSEIVPAQVVPKVVRDQCPMLPETAWHGLTKEFRELVGSRTEASYSYHLFTFLLAVGAFLGRSVYIEKAGKHYPNLFVVLVGPSGGGRKGTAMDFGMDLVKALDPSIGITRTIDSREGFSDYLQGLQEKQSHLDYISAIVRLSELRSLIDKSKMEGVRNIVPMLCEAYDCPESLDVQTRHNKVCVTNPTVALLAGTTMRWVEGITEADLQGGLGNRIAWCPGLPGEALPDPPPLEQQSWNKLIHGIHDVGRYWREKKSTAFTFTSEAAQQWNKQIYPELYGHRQDEPLIAVLSERLQNHCLKAALIFAALDGKPIIEAKHLDAAYALTTFLYDALWYLFRGFGASPMAQLDQKIIEIVRQSGPEGIRQREIKRRLWRIDAETLNRRLFALTAHDGPLERIEIGKKIILIERQE